MDKLTVKALGKINLGLDVVKKREDGYHEVRMIMQTVHLYDLLTIAKDKKPGISLTTNLNYLPVNGDNLCVKAAQMLMDEFQIDTGIRMNLKKHIPVAAGMAGGSTDAAAVLYGMNQIFQLGLSRQELMERGVKIGADVPYCIMRGTALAEGIGEKLSPLPPMVKCPVLIAKPSISVSTKYVYEHLNLGPDSKHPDIDALISDISQGDLHQIGKDMGNILETVTISKYPVIEEIKNVMKEYGAVNAMMSGSGPTVFGLFEDEQTMKKAKKALESQKLCYRAFATTIYNNRRG